MNNLHDTLIWIKNRCLLRYKEDHESHIIKLLNLLIGFYDNIETCNIQSSDLDSILSKYYFDFYMDKSTNSDGFSMGFSDADRAILRHNITNIYKDITRHISENNSNKTETDHKNIFDNEEICGIISNYTEV